MIALLDGTLYEMSPLINLGGEYSIGINDEGDVEAFIGDTRIDYGVFFRSFNKSVDIHPKTGKITINYPNNATIRGIFGDFHRDIELKIFEQ